MVINPLWWMGVSIAVLTVVRLVDAQRRRHATAIFADIARAARMNYSAIDRFDLASRLQQSPQWTAGMTVHDVIYGARDNERRFVATIERRATPDDLTQFWVVSCAERLDHSDLRELAPPIPMATSALRADAYRQALGFTPV